MDDVKVTITEDDIYGFEVRSPDFKPEIKVKFALDIPVKKRKIIQAEIKGIKQFIDSDKQDFTPEEESVRNEQSKKYGELMVQAIVLDWNLYDTDGSKLPINAETLDGKLSTMLSKWISETAMSFFTTPDKKD